MTFHIREAREAAGLSQRELAKIVGVAPNTFHGYESGKHDPKSDLLVKIARACGVSVDFLLGVNEHRGQKLKENAPSISDEARNVAKRYDALDAGGKGAVCAIMDYEERRQRDIRQTEEEQDNIIYLTFNDQKASAGIGFDLDEEHMEKWAVLYNDFTRRADFCISVDGDSMEPMYHDGDIVLVRQQPAVDVGEIGLYIKDGKGYIKCQGDGMIESLNPEYEDIAPTKFEDIICKGKVLGRLKSEWIR